MRCAAADRPACHGSHAGLLCLPLAWPQQSGCLIVPDAYACGWRNSRCLKSLHVPRRCGVPANSRFSTSQARHIPLQVFFAPNMWPHAEAPALQPCMEAMYARCTGVADALLRIFAVALGAGEHFFEDKTDAHHSNMQVANYASLVMWPEGAGGCMRKKAHVDSGTLTLLASDDWLGGSWQVRPTVPVDESTHGSECEFGPT